MEVIEVKWSGVGVSQKLPFLAERLAQSVRLAFP